MNNLWTKLYRIASYSMVFFVIELSQRFASEGRLEGKNGDGSVLSFLDVMMRPQYPEGANITPAAVCRR